MKNEQTNDTQRGEGAATLEDFWGAPISVYSRADAVADGYQIPIPENIAAACGFKIPVFITSGAFSECIEKGLGLGGMNFDGRKAAGRVVYLLQMLLFSIRRLPAGCDRLFFYCGATELYSLVGPTDFDNPAPCLCISLPGED